MALLSNGVLHGVDAVLRFARQPKFACQGYFSKLYCSWLPMLYQDICNTQVANKNGMHVGANFVEQRSSLESAGTGKFLRRNVQ